MGKPVQQARFAHQPAGFILWVFAVFVTGGLFGFGVNLAVGNPAVDNAADPAQADISAPPEINTPRASAELDKFDIQTDSHKKEVHIQLYSRSALPAPQVRQSGRRVAITLPNTRLSSAMLESGLPVVTDNRNSLVGRAVPADNNAAQIVIPSLPNRHYKVVVDVRPAQIKLAAEPQPPVLMLNQAENAESKSSADASESLPLRPRAHADSMTTPRAAVSSGASPLESLVQLPVTPTVVKPWSKLRPVQNLSASPTATASGNAPMMTPQGQAGPAIVSTSSTASVYQPGAMVWNPYVSGGQVMAGSMPAQQIPDLTAGSPRFSYHQDYPSTASVPPRLDPLWYLHQLGGNRPAVSGASEPALPPRPEIPASGAATSSTPLVEVPDLTKGTTFNAATAGQAPSKATVNSSGSITIDQTFIAGIKETLRQIPVWVYALVILFFAGIGLFMLLASMVLLQQLWQQTRMALQQQRARKNAPVPRVPTPQELEELQRVRAHQHAIQQALHTDLNLEDTPRLNSLNLLKEMPHSMKEALSNTAQARQAARKINARIPVSRTALF